MPWKVSINRQAAKKMQKIKGRPAIALRLLLEALRDDGPYQPRRPNFGKLRGKKDEWHCHLNRGRPTYVVCWRLIKGKKNEEEIEVFYAWTHEGAPY